MSLGQKSECVLCMQYSVCKINTTIFYLCMGGSEKKRNENEKKRNTKHST